MVNKCPNRIQLEKHKILLLSIKERSTDGSIRLSKVDQNAISHAIDIFQEKLNGGE